MKILGTILAALGGFLATVLLLGLLGAGSGWVMDRIVGPPATWKTALAHAVGTGGVSGALLAVGVRGSKGVNAGCTVVLVGIGGALLTRWIFSSWNPPGWLFGAAVWGGGFGALLFLTVTFGRASVISNERRHKPPSE